MSLQEAVKSLLEIGKRDLSNPKYDSYFNSLQEELNKCTSQLLQPRCPKCRGINLEMHFTDDGCQICYCRNPKCKHNSVPAEFFSAPPAARVKKLASQIADTLAEKGFHRDCGNNNRLVIENELEIMKEIAELAILQRYFLV